MQRATALAPKGAERARKVPLAQMRGIQAETFRIKVLGRATSIIVIAQGR